MLLVLQVYLHVAIFISVSGFVKGGQAYFCTSEVQKYEEVPRSTEKYGEVPRSTKEVRKKYASLPDFYPQTEQKFSVIDKCQKLSSQKENKNVLLLKNVKNSVPKNGTLLFCFGNRSPKKYREVRRSTEVRLSPLG